MDIGISSLIRIQSATIIGPCLQAVQGWQSKTHYLVIFDH